MPAILTTPEECDTWLSAESPEALELQRPAARLLTHPILAQHRDSPSR